MTETFGGHTLDELEQLRRTAEMRPYQPHLDDFAGAAWEALPDLFAAVAERNELRTRLAALEAPEPPTPCYYCGGDGEIQWADALAPCFGCRPDDLRAWRAARSVDAVH